MTAKRKNRPPVEGGPTRIVPTRLTPAQIDGLWKLASANDRGLSGEIRHAVRLHLQRAAGE
jgi:hypothetical protein